MKILSFLAIRRLKSLWLAVILVLSGYLISESKKTEHRKNHLSATTTKKATICMVVIQDEPEEKEKSIKILAEVVSILKHNKVITSSGEVLLYFKKTVKSQNLQCGDQLFIPNRFSDIKDSGNPGAFDYGTFCRSQGIYQSAYLKDTDFAVIAIHQNSPSYLKRISNSIKTIIASHIPDSQAKGMALALLIGYRKGIDNDTYQAYASTGLMHLIAISGMHIGMIYLTIQFILKRISWFKTKNDIQDAYCTCGIMGLCYNDWASPICVPFGSYVHPFRNW